MPLPINVEDLLYQRKVERTRIEYKEGWNPEPIIHTITAFANDFDNMGGGYILIGVEEENGRPVFPIKGLNPDSIDSIQQDILNKCNRIVPRFIPVIEPYTFEGVEILVLWAPGGEDRPYKCPEFLYSNEADSENSGDKESSSKGGKKKIRASNMIYYIRKGARTLKPQPHEERELISMARDIPYDDRINYHANIADMKTALIADYLYTVKSDLYTNVMNRSVESVATDMQLVRGPSEYRKPVNVGLMFFNESPERFFPYARIEVVDKPDPTGVGMQEKTFTGPLDKQLRDALAYIKNYIMKEYVTKVPNSEIAIRAFNWPYQAIEEALSNAVYHKSYQLHEPITVTITPEKMEILSFPGPDRSISNEDLEKCILVSKRYRNRRIGDYLKELGIVEGRNTGVPLILSAMQENGSEPPVFTTDSDRSFFQITLPIHPLFLTNSSPKVAQQGATNDKTVRKTRSQIREEMLALLSHHEELSASEIASKLGYSKVTDTLRAVIGDLLSDGIIKYLIPEKPNSRNQKLLLSDR